MEYILITDPFGRKPFDVISILKKQFKEYKIIIGLNQINFCNRFFLKSFYGKVII